MEHLLVEEHTGELMSACSVVPVCYDIKGQKSMPRPETWKRAIMLYDTNATLKA